MIMVVGAPVLIAGGLPMPLTSLSVGIKTTGEAEQTAAAPASLTIPHVCELLLKTPSKTH